MLGENLPCSGSVLAGCKRGFVPLMQPNRVRFTLINRNGAPCDAEIHLP